jgi:CRP/FNR family transcriptional regulator
MPFDTRPSPAASPDTLDALWTSAWSGLMSLPAGKSLLEPGARAQAIYQVRAGCLKSYTIDVDGTERVRAFYFPGDVIGFDALGADRYPAHVAAVTASQVCRLPVTELRALLIRAPELTQNLLERMSRDLAVALALSGDYSAEQRVAAFLVAMGERLGGGGSVRLPMARRDIASYLRLATETVCRVLGRLEQSGRIVNENKTVRMVDTARLRFLAGVPALHAA